MVNLSSPPHLGELLWCVRCNEYKPVTDAPPFYRARCCDCHKLRTEYGVAKITAETRIARHREQHPSHTVHMYDGEVVVRTFSPYRQATLTFDSGEIPF